MRNRKKNLDKDLGSLNDLSIETHDNRFKIAAPIQRRRTHACDNCKRKRIKCHGGLPCGTCISLNIGCTYELPRKKRGPQAKSSAVDSKSSFSLDCDPDQSLMAFDGLLLSVRRVKEHQDQYSQQGQNTPLFHVAGETVIFALGPKSNKPDKNSDPARRGEPHVDTILFFGRTSTSCTETLMKILSFSDGYATIFLDSSLSFPEPAPPMDILPCSSSLLKFIIHLYFSQVHPQIPMIDKRGFTNYSEYEHKNRLLLLYSMCAIVTQKSSVLEKYGINNTQELHGIFFSRAKLLLEKRFDWPQIYTVQALILLSLLGSGMNNGASAYQYIGIACRQAIELGLHRDVTSTRHYGHMDFRAKISSRYTWMCLYIVDRYVGVQLGRSTAISDNDMSESFLREKHNTETSDMLYHMQMCSIIGKVSNILNSHNFNEEGRSLITTFKNMKENLLELGKALPTPNPDETWSLRHHLYLLYHATYTLLHRMAPGLIDVSCVLSALKIRETLEPLVAKAPNNSTYEEYIFVMPVTVYFALTGASLLTDVLVNITNEIPQSEIYLPPGIDLKDEICKYVSIFNRLKEVSMYAIYYSEIIYECLKYSTPKSRNFREEIQNESLDQQNADPFEESINTHQPASPNFDPLFFFPCSAVHQSAVKNNLANLFYANPEYLASDDVSDKDRINPIQFPESYSTNNATVNEDPMDRFQEEPKPFLQHHCMKCNCNYRYISQGTSLDEKGFTP